MAKKGPTQFQVASAAIHNFLAEGTRPDPAIEAHHRRPWDTDAPITRPGSSASANFGVFGQLVGMCLGGRTRAAAERYFDARWTDELERVGIGCSEGPFSGYDTIHESAPPLVHHLTDSQELRALARRRARAKWELVRRCSVVLGGELVVVGPGNRFDQGSVGLFGRMPHAAILAHQARAWHPYDVTRPIKNPGAAEWLLRAVRLTSWEDIREEPLRLEDVRSMSTLTCWRWSNGSFAAWIDRAVHGWDPALLGVVVRDPREPEWLFPQEFLDGGNPREGGWSGDTELLELLASPFRLGGQWIAGKERYEAGPAFLPPDPGAGFLADTAGGVEDGSWPDLAGLQPIPDKPRKPGPKPKPDEPEEPEEEPVPEEPETVALAITPGDYKAVDTAHMSGPSRKWLLQTAAGIVEGTATVERLREGWVKRVERQVLKGREG